MCTVLSKEKQRRVIGLIICTAFHLATTKYCLIKVELLYLRALELVALKLIEIYNQGLQGYNKISRISSLSCLIKQQLLLRCNFAWATGFELFCSPTMILPPNKRYSRPLSIPRTPPVTSDLALGMAKGSYAQHKRGDFKLWIIMLELKQAIPIIPTQCQCQVIDTLSLSLFVSFVKQFIGTMSKAKRLMCLIKFYFSDRHQGY